MRRTELHITVSAFYTSDIPIKPCLNLFKQFKQNFYLNPHVKTHTGASNTEGAKAFAPSHITGIFQIFDHSADNLKNGSKGAGAALSRGVTTTVKAENFGKSSLQIKINGSVSNSAEVSKHVVETFFSKFKEEMVNQKIVVEHQVDMPIGAGFGTSGAAALSLALALNETFELGMSKTEAAQIAHATEVECKTGLGTVIAETFGGIEIRTKPGAPGIGEIKHIPAKEDLVVACLSFGTLSTKKCLTDEAVRKRINEFGGKLLDMLVEEPSVANLMKLSRQFAEHIELMTENIRKVLKVTDEAGFVCSMPMFGESVFTIIEKSSLKELLKIFDKHGLGGKTIISEIDYEGARLLP